MMTFCFSLATFVGCAAIPEGSVREDQAKLGTFMCVDPPADTSAVIDDSDDVSSTVATAQALAGRRSPIEASAFAQSNALRVRADVDAESIQTVGAGAYARVLFDDISVNVLNYTSVTTAVPSADLTIYVGRRDLLGVTLIATYQPTSAGYVIGVEAPDDGAGAGPGIPLGPTSITSMGGCTGEAYEGLTDDLPLDMPPVHFPKLTGGCNHNQCVEIRRSWIRGHIDVFYAHLMVEYVASLDGSTRSYVWSRPGRDAANQLTDGRTAPSYWFGAYNASRFSKIREIVNDLWNVYRNVKTGGIALRQHCPVAADVGNVCFNVDGVLAHHWVKGRIEYCDAFFDEGVRMQTWVTIHEPTHHLWVNGLMVGDTHTHWHGPNCVSSPVTEAIYGEEEAHELAAYVNANNSACNHRDIATRTVDSYAQMILWFGGSLLDGSMVSWPAWGDPTPTPPSCDPLDRGSEGCECASVTNGGDYSSPDGDYSVNQVCYDNDGEMTCATTTFNASDTVGICTRCGEFDKSAGCACQSDEQCAVGLFCYGTDTQNGNGVGHCYDQDPPSWVCLADCKALFNDPLAECWNTRPGGARCLDSGCDQPTEFNCLAQGKVCRDGQCVVECQSQKDCIALGYPAAFECTANSCQRP